MNSITEFSGSATLIDPLSANVGEWITILLIINPLTCNDRVLA